MKKAIRELSKGDFIYYVNSTDLYEYEVSKTFFANDEFVIRVVFVTNSGFLMFSVDESMIDSHAFPHQKAGTIYTNKLDALKEQKSNAIAAHSFWKNNYDKHLMTLRRKAYDCEQEILKLE